MGTTSLGVGGRGFDTRGCFFPSSRLSCCCGFGLRLLRPGRLPGGGRYRLLGSLRDRLRRGIWIRWWSGGSFDDTTSSNDVIPPLAQVHLFGRGPGPLSFRSGRVAFGDSLSAALECLLCKIHHRFFPFYTATIVRRVVSPAATALRMFPRGRASTGAFLTSPLSGREHWRRHEFCEVVHITYM